MNKALARNLSAVLSTALLPAVLAKSCFDEQLRTDISERMAAGTWREFANLNQPIWFHAASVGEVGGIASVLRSPEIGQGNSDFLLSTTSLTGKNAASEIAKNVALLPFDFPSFLRKAVQILKPKLFVSTETELWPNLFYTLDRSQVPIVIVNGTISEYSFPNYFRFRGFFEPLMEIVSKFYLQSDTDAERFIALGAKHNKIEVVGSTKYDKPAPILTTEEKDLFLKEIGLNAAKPLFVAGSVREGEDKQVIDAFLIARESVPGLQMIIAPRHPERFETVSNLLSQNGLEHNRFSKETSQDRAILLLDVLGKLNHAYAVSDFAFIGGTLVDIGGHNPLEPAACRMPVILGPHTSKIKEIVAQFKTESGHIEVLDSPMLAGKMVEILKDDKFAMNSANAVHRVWKNNQGSTAKVISLIQSYM